MKKILTILISLLVTTLILGQEINRSYDVPPFTGIEAGGVFDITVTKSSVNSVSTTSNQEIAKYINVKVKNGILKLDLDTDAMPVMLKRNTKYVKAHIAISQMDRIYLSGAAKLKSSGVFNPGSFRGDFSGAATAYGVNINSEELSVQVSGASKVEINGKINKVKYDISGASVVTIEHEAAEIKVGASGASKMEYTGTSTFAEISISGATNVKLRGSATTASFEASGASQLDAEYFTVRDAEIEASGVSNIRTTATGTISAEITGGSVLKYAGNPAIKKIETSSQASIQRIK
ncbi:MAG: DUF2807 domain-containing protein [Bacteroidales bacterium]